MSDNQEKNTDSITTKIWFEVEEQDNPFVAAKCYCSGFDVYGDLLGKISWPDYLLLLMTQERPEAWKSRLFELTAISLANPGPRDHSVQAAMSASVGGSTSASSLISALAVGAGQLGGAHEVYKAMKMWKICNNDLSKFVDFINSTASEPEDIWPAMEHIPGFDPYGVSCSTPVKKVLETLAAVYEYGILGWIYHKRDNLERVAKYPLAISGVAAAAFIDIGMSPQEGEMLYLLLRLPGAAAHALEQNLQWKNYPFYRNGLKLTNDPSCP